jgi:hypothetical protein
MAPTTTPLSDNPLTVAGFTALAEAGMAPGIRDFIAGAAGDERTLAADLEVFTKFGYCREY